MQRSLVRLTLAVVLLGTAVSTSAQGVEVSPSLPTPAMRPDIAVAIEAGGLLQSESNRTIQPIWLPSVQVGLGRRFAIQWETSRWTQGAELPLVLAYRAAGVAISPSPPGTVPTNRTVTTLGINVRYRRGGGRWSGFVGAGMNYQRTNDRLSGRAVLCGSPFHVPAPRPLCIVPDGRPTEIQEWRYRPQVLGGAEFRIADRLAGVGSVRVDGTDPVAVGVTGGIRLSLQPQPRLAERQATDPARAVGKEVRVTDTDGSKRVGRLVTLSTTEVVFSRQGQEVTLPLDRVRTVEQVSRGVKKGALIGLATGAALSLLATCDTQGDDCPNPYAWVPIVMLIEGGIGAGVGAGIGAIVNATHRAGNQLYASPGSGRVTVSPLLTRGRRGMGAGAELAVRW